MEFFFEDYAIFEYDQNVLINQVKYLIENELRDIGDLSVIFCSDKYLLEVNKQYLDHNYYTDIITFDYVQDNIISGDLFISIDRIKDNAREYESSMIEELYRVVFHGVLHLVGYNDKTEEEQTLMTEKENFYLNRVDFKGLKL